MKAKCGLVLEGGAMRGLFTAGVLDVFLEEGIEFDAAVGVSAGAAFGCNFKSRQKGRVVRYNTQYCRDKRYCSLFSLLTTGDLYGADFCYRLLPEELDPFHWKEYNENPLEFYAALTRVETGRAEYFSCTGEKERVMKIFQASASMPLVSRKVTVDGKEYLDGGVSASIPLGFMEEKGMEKNVVILTQPRDYVKPKSSALSLVRLCYRKDPLLCRAMERRHLVYREEKELVFRREREGSAFVFAPSSPLPVSRTEKDPEKLYQAYEMGQEEARKKLSALKAFLNM